MKTLRYTCLAICIGLLSCADSPNQENQSISFNPSKKELKSIDDLTSKIRYIKLETENKNLIAHISNVHFIEKNIFIHDKISSAIYCFRSDGKYRYTIKATGRGPNEIGFLSTFAVNTDIGTLLIGDNSKHKFFEFDLDGNLLEVKSFDSHLYLLNAFCLSNNLIATHNSGSTVSNNNLIMLSGVDYEVLRSYFPISTEFDKMFCSFAETKSNYVIYSFGLNDTIFKVNRSNGEISPYYYVDFGTFKVDEEIKNLPGHREILMKINEDETNIAYCLKLVGESSKYLIFSYVYIKGTKYNFAI